jgi:hypothetical protein
VAETAPLHDPVDEWHDHSHDEKPQRPHADVQSSNLVLGVGIALAAVIAISVLAVYGFYVHYNTQRMDLREHTTSKNLPGLAPSPADETRVKKSKDLITLERGGEVRMPTEKENVSRKVTIVPMSQAMEEVVQTYTASKPAQGR